MDDLKSAIQAELDTLPADVRRRILQSESLEDLMRISREVPESAALFVRISRLAPRAKRGDPELGAVLDALDQSSTDLMSTAYRYPFLLTETGRNLLAQIGDAATRADEKQLARYVSNTNDTLEQVGKMGFTREELARLAQSAGRVRERIQQHLAGLPPDKRAGLEQVFEQANGLDEIMPALRQYPELYETVRSLLDELAEVRGEPLAPRQFWRDLRLALEASDRYRQSCAVTDLNEAIDSYSRIVDDPAFATASETFRVVVLGEAGEAIMERYSVTESPSDLDTAILLLEDAVRQKPRDPDRELWVSLAHALLLRYATLAQDQDFERLVELYSIALEDLEIGSFQWHKCITGWAQAMAARYEKIGDSQALDKAIELYRKAAELPAKDARWQVTILWGLGANLDARYRLLQQREDLSDAVRTLEEAMEAALPESAVYSLVIEELGIVLDMQYEATGELSCLVRAAALFRRGARSFPRWSVERSNFLARLGLAQSKLYARTRRLKALNESIDAYREASECPSLDADARRMALRGLAQQLAQRYLVTSRRQDSDEAMRIATELGISLDAENNEDIGPEME